MVNVTLCFFGQSALLAAKAGDIHLAVRRPAGRGRPAGMELISDIR